MFFIFNLDFPRNLQLLLSIPLKKNGSQNQTISRFKSWRCFPMVWRSYPPLTVTTRMTKNPFLGSGIPTKKTFAILLLKVGGFDAKYGSSVELHRKIWTCPRPLPTVWCFWLRTRDEHVKMTKEMAKPIAEDAAGHIIGDGVLTGWLRKGLDLLSVGGLWWKIT